MIFIKLKKYLQNFAFNVLSWMNTYLEQLAVHTTLSGSDRVENL